MTDVDGNTIKASNDVLMDSAVSIVIAICWCPRRFARSRRRNESELPEQEKEG